MTPREYFEKKIPARLKTKSHEIAQINAVYEFQLTGPQGGTWTVDLTVPGGKVSKGSGGKADCTVTMEGDDFAKMTTGQLNPQIAFMTRKLKVAGNIGLALKLGTIL